MKEIRRFAKWRYINFNKEGIDVCYRFDKNNSMTFYPKPEATNFTLFPNEKKLNNLKTIGTISYVKSKTTSKLTYTIPEI